MEKEKKQKQNEIEGRFLNVWRRERTLLDIYLLDGRNFKGFLTTFDRYTISIVEDHYPWSTVIWKHAIGTITTEIDREKWERLKKPIMDNLTQPIERRRGNETVAANR